MAKNSNNLRLQNGRLTPGNAPVGSLSQARKLGGNLNYGTVQYPRSKQITANKSAGIDSFKQRVAGFWGKG